MSDLYEKIVFTIYFGGISGELYSEKIMIYKPFENFSKTFYWDENNKSCSSVAGLIESFKCVAENEATLMSDLINLDTIYIKTDDEFLGLTEDKQISNIFSYFEKDVIEFVFFIVCGASFNCDGYLFIVHPNKDIHRNTPHVHVRRDDEESRYYLDALERFQNDKVSRRFLKDENKAFSSKKSREAL